MGLVNDLNSEKSENGKKEETERKRPKDLDSSMQKFEVFIESHDSLF